MKLNLRTLYNINIT